MEIKTRAKRIIICYIVGGVLLALAFPGQGVTASSTGSYPAPGGAPVWQYQSRAVSSAVVAVSVASQPAARPAISAVSTAVAQNCRLSPRPSGGLLQQAQVINLNLPARCFLLSIGKSAPPAASLAVKPLEQTLPAITLPINRVAIAGPDLSSQPVGRNNPAFPLANPYAGGSRAVELRVLPGKDNLTQKTAGKLLVELNQFVVLRC